MAYCSRCGNELNDKAVVCVRCGEPCETRKANPNDASGGGWLFLLSLFVPQVGLIVGFVLHNEGQIKLAKKCFIGAAVGIICIGIVTVMALVLPFLFL